MALRCSAVYAFECHGYLPYFGRLCSIGLCRFVIFVCVLREALGAGSKVGLS